MYGFWFPSFTILIAILPQDTCAHTYTHARTWKKNSVSDQLTDHTSVTFVNVNILLPCLLLKAEGADLTICNILIFTSNEMRNPLHALPASFLLVADLEFSINTIFLARHIDAPFLNNIV